MAAHVVPDPTFSALYNDTTKWTHPTLLDYEYYTERVGAIRKADRTITTLYNY